MVSVLAPYAKLQMGAEPVVARELTRSALEAAVNSLVARSFLDSLPITGTMSYCPPPASLRPSITLLPAADLSASLRPIAR
jgi:hypothetical protein